MNTEEGRIAMRGTGTRWSRFPTQTPTLWLSHVACQAWPGGFQGERESGGATLPRGAPDLAPPQSQVFSPRALREGAWCPIAANQRCGLDFTMDALANGRNFRTVNLATAHGNVRRLIWPCRSPAPRRERLDRLPAPLALGAIAALELLDDTLKC